MRRRQQSIWLILITNGIASTSYAQVPERPDFTQHIQPILQTLCYDCHGDGADEGSVQFDTAESDEALIANQKLWGKVWDNVLAEMMPPADMSQPTETERRTLTRWIGQTVFQLDPDAPDPGRVTIRRLNRVEYRYSVLDLLGIDFPVGDHFPADDTGYGFDTIGDVLTVPPTLMGKYFVAAERISAELLEQETAAKSDRSDANEQVFFGFDPQPTEPEEQFEHAREIVKRLATKAYRRPVDESTLEKLLGITKPAFDAGEASYAEVVCRAIEAILVSPRFIYRAEFQPGPDDPHSVHLLDEFALASRLSCFLWSSLPDEQLLDLAAEGRLRAELRAQVERMLQDEKSSRFVENFVGQWLQTRGVVGIHRSDKLQKKIRRLRSDMQDETYAFFTHIMRENRGVIELVAADYSFLTEDLAKFYGVPDVSGSEPQFVKFSDNSPRGGILTHASVLLMTSNPDRTSPVKRGQFVLDNILGMPAPPPPQDVPPLEDSQVEGEKLGLLAQLARHRADPSCAVCHDRMDPLGLGLENFDAIGRWRDEAEGEPIDASSQLASGEKFSGISELREILATKRHLFYRCLTKKLMTYGLGRGIEYTDNMAIETIVDAMLAEEGHFLTLLMGIVESPQFQMRRGNDIATEE